MWIQGLIDLSHIMLPVCLCSLFICEWSQGLTQRNRWQPSGWGARQRSRAFSTIWSVLTASFTSLLFSSSLLSSSLLLPCPDLRSFSSCWQGVPRWMSQIATWPRHSTWLPAVVREMKCSYWSWAGLPWKSGTTSWWPLCIMQLLGTMQRPRDCCCTMGPRWMPQRD